MILIFSNDIHSGTGKILYNPKILRVRKNIYNISDIDININIQEWYSGTGKIWYSPKSWELGRISITFVILILIFRNNIHSGTGKIWYSPKSGELGRFSGSDCEWETRKNRGHEMLKQKRWDSNFIKVAQLF